MFEFIRGRLHTLTPTSAVLETSGIGYILQITTQTFAALEGKDDITLYVHQVLREDTNDLYGFITRDERELFRLLISVSGVGPSTARMMLSAYDVAELAAFIHAGNDAALRQIKGIGTKTAQRIIVDLQGKMEGTDLSGGTASVLHNTAKSEALSALTTLGFSRSASEKALDALLKQSPALSVEQLIKLALKQL